MPAVRPVALTTVSTTPPMDPGAPLRKGGRGSELCSLCCPVTLNPGTGVLRLWQSQAGTLLPRGEDPAPLLEGTPGQSVQGAWPGQWLPQLQSLSGRMHNSSRELCLAQLPSPFPSKPPGGPGP